MLGDKPRASLICSSQLSEGRQWSPQSSHSNILLSNYFVVAHKSSKGGNHASLTLAKIPVCLHNVELYGLQRPTAQSLEEGLQIGFCGYEDSVFSLFLCGENGPSVAVSLNFLAETEKSEFYMKFPCLKYVGK